MEAEVLLVCMACAACRGQALGGGWQYGSVGMGEDWVLRWRVYRGTFCVAWLDCSSSKYVIAVMCVELVVKSWILVRGL